MKNKIILFSWFFYDLEGGAEVFVNEVTKRMPEYEFHIISAKVMKNVKKYEKIENQNIYRVGFGNFLDKFLFPITGYFKAMKLKAKYKKDIIMVHSVMANAASVAAYLFKKSSNYPSLLTLQNGDDEKAVKKKLGIILFQLFKKMHRSFDYIHSISNYLKKRAIKYGADKNKITIVPNGVNFSNFKKAKLSEIKALKKKLGIKNEKVIITTSRLSYKNGIEYMIRSVPYIKERGHKVKMLILGTGPEEKNLKGLRRKLKLEKDVLFIGFVPHEEISKYISSSDIFIRPSLSEGLGNSFLEAMYAKVPIIGTPVGGIPDFLKDGETGLFCKPQDGKSAADAIIKYIENPKLYNKIKETGSTVVKEGYSWDHTANKIKKVYKEVLK